MLSQQTSFIQTTMVVDAKWDTSALQARQDHFHVHRAGSAQPQDWELLIWHAQRDHIAQEVRKQLVLLVQLVISAKSTLVNLLPAQPVLSAALLVERNFQTALPAQLVIIALRMARQQSTL